MSVSGLEISNGDPATRFEFEAKVGEGSYGAVYKAIDLTTGRTVAVKVLELAASTDGEIQDLTKEINILRSCTSPHIVAYLGAYVRENQLWIAMEYCGAGSFSDLMAICDTTLGELEISAVIYQSLLGLDYLHKNKKIHRDIKSGNILLTDDGFCKICDFGVSAEMATTMAKAKTMIGTPYFIAPEVLMSSDYNNKADIWSLGITAYELAVGQPPLADIHPMRVIFQIPNLPPPRLPDDWDFSPQFKQFIQCCLQKEPEERLSAAQLLKLPFFDEVRNGNDAVIVVNSLLARCSDALEKWKRWEEEERELAANQEHGNNTFGAAIDQTMSSSDGTVIIKNHPTSDGTIIKKTNPTLLSPKQTFQTTNIKVNAAGPKAAQQVRDQHDALNQMGGDGTFVVKAPVKTKPPPPQTDMSTVRTLKLTPGPNTRHFGTLKIKPGQNPTILVTRPVNSPPQQQVKIIPDLTLANSLSLVSALDPEKATRADVQRIRAALEQNRTKDLTDIAAFYSQRMKELDKILDKKK